MRDMMGKPLEVGTKVLYFKSTRTSYIVSRRTIVGFTERLVRFDETDKRTSVQPRNVLAYDWEDER